MRDVSVIPSIGELGVHVHAAGCRGPVLHVHSTGALYRGLRSELSTSGKNCLPYVV